MKDMKGYVSLNEGFCLIKPRKVHSIKTPEEFSGFGSLNSAIAFNLRLIIKPYSMDFVLLSRFITNNNNNSSN